MATLDDLKQRIKDTPIQHILSHYINVIPKGSAFTAICPFHDDHNPSLHINPSRNSFKCFVDNIGGDAITFVMSYKNLNFVEALQEICRVQGWAYDDYVQRKEVSPLEAMARRILDLANKLYQKTAWTPGTPHFPDFLKSRGLSEEAAKVFQLGFAPPGNALSRYLTSIKDDKEREFAIDTAKKIQIIADNKYREGETYDLFNNRITFPIWNAFGHVVGFTSRATLPEQKPKYLNSKESFVFKKGQLLYGFHLAKPSIKSLNQVILCEGNMDMIALYNHGFEHSVAIMGTAMSDQALDRLTDMTQNIYMVFDSDQAGVLVTKKVNQACLARGLTPRQIRLPDEFKDPDEFLTTHGALAFQKLIDEARPYVDWELEESLPKTTISDTTQKIAYLEQAFEIIAPLGTGLHVSERLVNHAKRLGLQSSSEEISASYKKFCAHKESASYKRAQVRVHDSGEQNGEQDEKDQKVLTRSQGLSRSERRLVQELVQHPECLTHSKMAELLDFIEADEVKTYVSKLKRLVLEIEETEFSDFAQNLLNSEEFGAELREVVGYALEKHDVRSQLNDQVVEKLLSDLKRKLREDQLKTQRDETKRRLEECTEPQERTRLMSQLLEVQKQLNDRKKS
jgi:DNA primase